MSRQPDFAEFINAEELAELALRLANTFSPAGHEQAMADTVLGWFEQQKIPVRQQPILPDRANVIATLKGSGGGTSLIFNSHMDTEVSGPEYDWGMMQPDLNVEGAHREGNRLYGHTVLNDRGLMTTTMITMKALRDSGAARSGDVIFTGVVGETGSSPVDEFQGLAYEGKGIGSRFLVSHGVRADYALVAETTDFALSWVACGACYLKVSVPGTNIYTPRSHRPDDVWKHPNAIVRMARVIEAIEAWAPKYEARQSFDSPCGRMVPKVVIGAIRGGVLYRPNRTAPHCAIFVDVRMVPGEDPLRIERELQSVVETAEVGARVETYLARHGAIGKNVERLAEEVRRSYQQVSGKEPVAPASTETVSMWRDNNVFNRAGIPSLTFGCGRTRGEDGRLYLDIGDLVTTATVYARVAQSLCEKPSQGAY
jgi:acetylornithine deacetylase/succinyl-diaminopimelate desuccinylase-like protein